MSTPPDPAPRVDAYQIFRAIRTLPEKEALALFLSVIKTAIGQGKSEASEVQTVTAWPEPAAPGAVMSVTGSVLVWPLLIIALVVGVVAGLATWNISGNWLASVVAPFIAIFMVFWTIGIGVFIAQSVMARKSKP